MATFEIILIIVIILLVIYLIRKINQIDQGKLEPKSYGEIMGKVSELKTIIDEREKKQDKLEEQRNEFMKNNNELISGELASFFVLL